MPSLVRGRVVQHKQRLEFGQRRLRDLALHLLGLIHDDNRMVGGNHINRPAAAEFVALRVNDAALLAASPFLHRGGKSLCIDNHHVQPGIRRE